MKNVSRRSRLSDRVGAAKWVAFSVSGYHTTSSVEMAIGSVSTDTREYVGRQDKGACQGELGRRKESSLPSHNVMCKIPSAFAYQIHSDGKCVERMDAAPSHDPCHTGCPKLDREWEVCHDVPCPACQSTSRGAATHALTLPHDAHVHKKRDSVTLKCA